MKRVLVFAPQGLGDSLEITPMLAALRAAEPAAHVTVAVLRGVARQLFDGLPALVDDIIELPFWELGRWAFLKSVLQQAPQRSYDLSFLPYPAARLEYAVLQLAFRSRKRLLHDYSRSLAHWTMAATALVVPVRPVHNVERNLDLLRALSLPAVAPPGYTVPKSWMAETRDPLHILIHPGTVAHDGLENRRWAPESFAEIGRRWIARGYRVDAICGPSDAPAVKAVRDFEPKIGIVEGTLAAVARIISGARMVIANDSGIAHLSAGVGTPVLTLFGPTPLEHAPYGPSARPLRPSPCPPCFDVRLLNTDCARGIDFACLKRDLRVGDVDAALEEMAAESAMLTGS